jgi:hypothetical protein
VLCVVVYGSMVQVDSALNLSQLLEEALTNYLRTDAAAAFSNKQRS